MSDTYKHKQKFDFPRIKEATRQRIEHDFDDSDDYFYQIGKSTTEIEESDEI